MSHYVYKHRHEKAARLVECWSTMHKALGFTPPNYKTIANKQNDGNRLSARGQFGWENVLIVSFLLL